MSYSDESDVTASLAAVTALARLNNKSGNDKQNANNLNNSYDSQDSESYTKKSISKLKSTNDLDRNELQKLNNQLELYLDKAKALEALNQQLLKEVEAARARQIPKSDDKKDLAAKLDKARVDLENVSKETVKYEIDYETALAARQEYMNRIKFLQNESDIQKQKIARLERELADIDDEREYIIRSATQAENDITREKTVVNKAEKDLETLRAELARLRNKNKEIEFEMETLQDEKEFCKAVHEEEIAALKNSLKATPSNRDLNKFYNDQLKQAVKDIKSDFQKLSKQQLEDLREQKEAELAFHKDTADRQNAILKKASAQEREIAEIALGQLPDINRKEKEELVQLNAKNIELANRMASLENALVALRAKHADTLQRQDNELSELRAANDNLFNELGYWDRVTRSKLQSEIMTYRNLLDCQTKILQTALSGSDSNKKPTTTQKTNEDSSKTSQSGSVNTRPVQPPPSPQAQPTQSQERPSTVIISGAQSNNKQPSPTQNNSGFVTVSGTTSNTKPLVQTQEANNKPAPQTPVNAGNVIFSSIGSSNTSQNQQQSQNNNQNRPSTVIINTAQTSQSSTKPPSPVTKQPVQQQTQSAPKQGSIYEQLKRVFDMFDQDGSGYINSLEFQSVLNALNIKLTKDVYEAILRDVDTDRSRDISFDEFCRIMEPAITGHFTREELYRAFKHFDTDNSGFITVQELQEILSGMGNKYTQQQIANMISTVDQDNDGRLNFEEFYTLLTRTNEAPSKVSVQPVKKKSVSIVTPVEKPKPKHYDVLKRVFDMFDKDNSGYINSAELNDVLMALDLQISDEAYEQILRDVDVDKSRNINFDEFCKIMAPALSGDFSREDLYFAFKHFDKDNSGYITVKELSQILSQIGQSFSEDQIARMVQKVDKDNDGRLNFDEFVQLLSTPLDR